MVGQETSHEQNAYLSFENRCGHAECHEPSLAKLGEASLCRSHFITSCYERLDQITKLIEQKNISAADLSSSLSFAKECTSVVVSCALKTRDLNNQDRARLLDIVLSAAHVLTRLRRSPRVAICIPLRLIGDPLTDPRIEDTITQSVSKHGAMFSCGHPYAKGEIMDVVRLDTGRTAIARVAWHKPLAPEKHNVAIEILNKTDFWDWKQS